RHREARQLDGAGDARLVYERNGRETLPDKNLSSLHVIGHQESVGRPARRRHAIAGGVDHEVLGRVAGADAAHISDVMVECSQNSMDPFTGRHGPLETAAAQNVLYAKGAPSA